MTIQYVYGQFFTSGDDNPSKYKEKSPLNYHDIWSSQLTHRNIELRYAIIFQSMSEVLK